MTPFPNNVFLFGYQSLRCQNMPGGVVGGALGRMLSAGQNYICVFNPDFSK
jgi:hypothetical protein